MLPVISVVCVYNREDVLNRCLLESCKRQQLPVETISVDNTNRRFNSAAAALNWGANQARGKWLVFAHQDVVLLTDCWSKMALEYLQKLNPSGWCGVVGRDAKGIWRGLLRDRDFVSGQPSNLPTEVQTLDEVVLIHRRETQGNYFDEALVSWHAYGVDACCKALTEGKRNYVLPLPVWHDSPSTNRANLAEAHHFVEMKYQRKLRSIKTTCGDIPSRFKRRGSYRQFELKHSLVGSLMECQAGLRPRLSARFQSPGEVLDDWTLSEDRVDCLRAEAWYSQINAVGFKDATERKRSIVHWFGDWENLPRHQRVLVFGPEVLQSKNLPSPKDCRLITCQIINSPFTPVLKHPFCRRSLARRQLCRDIDERYWLISEFH